MIITNMPISDIPHILVDDVCTVTVSPTVIRGEPVVAELSLNESELGWLQEPETKIKHGLVQKLAEAMYESGKYIEFTRLELINEQRTVFRARVFVTPGDVTQLLRTSGIIK